MRFWQLILTVWRSSCHCSNNNFLHYIFCARICDSGTYLRRSCLSHGSDIDQHFVHFNDRVTTTQVYETPTFQGLRYFFPLGEDRKIGTRVKGSTEMIGIRYVGEWTHNLRIYLSTQVDSKAKKLCLLFMSPRRGCSLSDVFEVTLSAFVRWV